MPEKYEQNLLIELEGLTNLQKLFQGFDNILSEFLEEYRSELDPNLVTLLEMYQYDVNLTLEGEIVIDDIKVPGIMKQLYDVADEVQVLQAGLATKHGIPDEDVEER